MKVSIIGLGKLGSSILASFASRGFKVIGYDVNKRISELISKRIAPFKEPHLQEFLEKYADNIKIVS